MLEINFCLLVNVFLLVLKIMVLFKFVVFGEEKSILFVLVLICVRFEVLLLNLLVYFSIIFMFKVCYGRWLMLGLVNSWVGFFVILRVLFFKVILKWNCLWVVLYLSKCVMFLGLVMLLMVIMLNLLLCLFL